MGKFLSSFWTITVLASTFALTLFSCNNAAETTAVDKDSLKTQYDIISNQDDFIILRKKSSAFINGGPGPLVGQIIKDSLASAEINAYRKKFPDPTSTKYVDFNFINLLTYVGHYKSPLGDVIDKTIGIRIYPALTDSGQLTMIFAPTVNDKALWRENLKASKTNNDVSPFNTGSICPCNCPDPTEAVGCKKNN